VIAVPVGSRAAVHFLRREADEVICLSEPEAFGAVGFWYEHFPQVGDAQVLALLERQGSRLAV
jgi:predicted phosphoribosyltransferase